MVGGGNRQRNWRAQWGGGRTGTRPEGRCARQSPREQTRWENQRAQWLFLSVLFWCYFGVIFLQKYGEKREEMDGVNKDSGDLNIIL
jgi:hypothetical protein